MPKPRDIVTVRGACCVCKRKRIIDQSKLADMRAEMEHYAQYEFVGWATHEQYFHADHLAYQPDIAEKLYTACDVLQ